MYIILNDSVVYVRPMKVKCCFRVSKKFVTFVEMVVIGLGQVMTSEIFVAHEMSVK